MAIICDFIISVVCPQTLPPERRINVSNQFRAYTLWFFLVAIFLTAGLTHGLTKYHTRTTVPVPDELYYVDWLSNEFCSNMNITTKWPLRVNAYLLDKDSSSKAMCNQSTETFAGPISETIPARDIYTMKVHFKNGDRISGQICMSREERIFIFTRRMDFLACVRSDSWTVCGLRGPTRYWVKSDCKDFDNFDNPFILQPQSISDTGEYYFVFYNSLSTATRVSARFTKTIFNEQLLQKAEKSCHDETLCEFDLGSVSESKVACFEATGRFPFPGDKDIGKDVNVSCKPRLWVYFMLFFVLPIIIAVIGTVLICKLCKRNGSSYHEPAGSLPSSQRHTPSSYSQRNSPSFSLRNNPTLRSSDQGTVPSRIRSPYQHTDLEDMHVNQSEGRYYGQDSTNENRNNLQQANNDAPPSYDEVMKGVFV